MVDIIRLHEDPHHHVQSVLPWYVNGTLNDAERTTVDAHVANCPECQADLRAEQALARQIADLPNDVDRGWTALRERLEFRSASHRRRSWRAPLAVLRRPVPVGWAITAQAASIALIAALVWGSSASQRHTYRALGAAPADAAANAIVIFKPTTQEQVLRSALSLHAARVVDGPTESGAYVLHVAPERRAATLADLRANPNVELAEPIDGEAR